MFLGLHFGHLALKHIVATYYGQTSFYFLHLFDDLHKKP